MKITRLGNPMSNHRSITQAIRSELNDELIQCKIRPGEKLLTNDLRIRFGVSLGVIREALSSLVSESLVTAIPQRGFRAREMSAQDLVSLSKATMGIEALCTRSALACGGEEWEKALKAALERVEQTPLRDSEDEEVIGERFIAAHQHFHEVLQSATDNQWLKELRDRLQTHAERYRYYCRPMLEPFVEAKLGHAQIAAAALDRNADLTVALIAEQFHRNVNRFVLALEAMEKEKASTVPRTASDRTARPA